MTTVSGLTGTSVKFGAGSVPAGHMQGLGSGIDPNKFIANLKKLLSSNTTVDLSAKAVNVLPDASLKPLSAGGDTTTGGDFAIPSPNLPVETSGDVDAEPQRLGPVSVLASASAMSLDAHVEADPREEIANEVISFAKTCQDARLPAPLAVQELGQIPEYLMARSFLISLKDVIAASDEEGFQIYAEAYQEKWEEMSAQIAEIEEKMKTGKASLLDKREHAVCRFVIKKAGKIMAGDGSYDQKASEINGLIERFNRPDLAARMSARKLAKVTDFSGVDLSDSSYPLADSSDRLPPLQTVLAHGRSMNGRQKVANPGFNKVK